MPKIASPEKRSIPYETSHRSPHENVIFTHTNPRDPLMFWGSKFEPARPNDADFEEQQKHNRNHRVTLNVSKTIGKYAVFLPLRLEAKMRVPL
jgi:hypothetical protein